MLEVDALVILSSVDGLFDGPPEAEASKLIRNIAAGDDSVLDFVQEEKTSFGRGGMATKLGIAKQTAKENIPVLLGNGRRPEVLLKLLEGNWPGTTVSV